MPAKKHWVRACIRCGVEKGIELEYPTPLAKICTSCRASEAAVKPVEKAKKKVKKVQTEAEKIKARQYRRDYYREYMRKRKNIPEEKQRGPKKQTSGKEKSEARKLKKLEEKKVAAEAKVEEVKHEVRKERVKKDPLSKELARRELCRRRLLQFIKNYNRKYEDGWVHRLICERLEQFMRDVEAKKAPRLMIFMPPRHGKSEIASKNFPAWLLGHHPDWEIIASSYAVSLPIDFSRKVRGLVRNSYYQKLFPETQLDRDSTSAERWLTTKGGGYVAAGVGGGITGKGAHVFIIDDPVKDAAEADSETIRDSAWDWYGSTAKTRLSPGGGMLVIQTRWHDDDLSGRLLSQMKEQGEELDEILEVSRQRLAEAEDKAEKRALRKEIEKFEEERKDLDNWEVISFPAESVAAEVLTPERRLMEVEDLPDEALRETVETLLEDRDVGTREPVDLGDGWTLLRGPGEALHPDRFSIGRLRNMKRSMQPRHWSALYQQNPVPDEGVYFRKEMLRYEPSVPDYRQWKVFIAADLAMSKKERADWSVFAVGALDESDQLHILDIVRVKQDTNDLVETLLTLVRKYKPEMTGLERGQYEIAIRPQLTKRMREERLFFTMADGDFALKPIQDKETRARPLQGRMQQGMVLFPADQPWLDQAVYELLRFPGGVHDDIVDALAWLARLAMMHEPPRPKKPIQLKSWKDKIRGHMRGSRHPMSA